jgi:hypothetical protein
MAKQHCTIERDYHEAKQELGLGYFEGPFSGTPSP